MQFDVMMELGKYYAARKALNSLTDKKSFEYLIREAKYKDHAEGNLDEAIRLMEQAFEVVKSNPVGWLWTKSNLGDMYGHANRFSESYQCYLEVLAKDPHYYHALKGIAWLAFSHDRDAEQAKEILLFLKQQHPVPDYDLLLAEIASFQGDKIANTRHLSNYLSATQNALYGGMYNKYTFSLQSGELNNPQRALQIAQQEVHNRPTPEAFSWLAWAYCQNGDVNKAMQTARYFVENKCFEPNAQYYLGMIYKAGGNEAAARKYLKAAKESAYELGPAVSEHVDQLLANL
jgi:tetratricopeptide (TPR) repeat protein